MYAATVNSRPLTFEVAGFWRRNMVMRDRETGSLWQQSTGEAVYGQLRGAQLEPLGGEQIRWAAWRKEHPDTLVAITPLNPPRSIIPRRAMTTLLETMVPRLTAPGLAGLDRRVSAHEEVAGISIAGEARAYPLSLLRQKPAINDELGGVPITIQYEPEADRVRAFRRDAAGQGEPSGSIPVSRQWWLGWSEFHPGTDVYTADSREA